MNKKQLSMITFAMILSNVMAGLDSTIINTAIPAIIADLHGIQFMGWIIALMLLGMSVSTPIWGKIGEKYGNKKAFEYSLVLFVLGSLFQGLAPNMFYFLISRTVMGIGAGGMGSLPYIMSGEIFRNIKQRTKILGYLGASFSVAAIAGPLVGGYLVDALSWHWVFYINIPIGLLAALISVMYYREERVKDPAKFDVIGSFLIVSSLAIILIAIQLLGIISPMNVAGLLIVGLLILWLFVRHERKVPSPVIPISMFKNQALVGDLLLFSFTWGAFLAVNTYLPMWAQGLLAASALMGGVTLIPNSIADTIGTLSVNSFKRYFSDHALILMSIILMIISSGSLIFVAADTNLWMLTFLGTFSGFGVGFIFVLLQVKSQVDAGEENMAPATSMSFLIRILAQTVMAAVYGVIMNIAIAGGIRQYPNITLNMMNKMSDAKSAETLPKALLPTMKEIFHTGLRNIMICATVLLVIALILNYIYNYRLSHKMKKD